MKPTMLFVIAGFAAATIGCGETDAGITTAVKSRLAADETVQASAIEVDTRERVVTLTGEVESSAEEAQALQIARSTDGVQEVIDQLEIAAEPDSAPTTGFDETPASPRRPEEDQPRTPTPKY